MELLKIDLENFSKRLVIGLILGISVFAIFAIISDIKKISFHFNSFKWTLLIPILILSLINYALRFLKWQYYLRQINIDCEISLSFKIFLSGLSMSITPGKIGEVLKSYLLKTTRNVAMSKTIPVVISERFTDVVALFILCVISFGGALFGIEFLIGGFFICFLFFISFSSTKVKNLILWTLKKVLKKRKIIDSMEESYEIQKSFLNFKPFIIATLLSVFAWFSECLGLFLTFKGFESIQTGIQNATFIYAISTLAGALSMIPGGLFATEASLYALIHKVFNLTPDLSLAITITIIIRICTLWFAVIIGIFALSKVRKFLHTSGK